MGRPASVNSAMAPIKRTPPLGTARLYSNQKSKRSPTKCNSVAGRPCAKPSPRAASLIHVTKARSRSTLDIAASAPKCRSEAKWTQCASLPNTPRRADSTPLPRRCVAKMAPSRSMSMVWGMLLMPYARAAPLPPSLQITHVVGPRQLVLLDGLAPAVGVAVQRHGEDFKALVFVFLVRPNPHLDFPGGRGRTTRPRNPTAPRCREGR